MGIEIARKGLRMMGKRGRTGVKQLEILEYIYQTIEENGYPPTVREIGDATELSSTATVYGHLKRLADKGFINRGSSKMRAIEVTTQGLKELDVSPYEDELIPLLGTVSAGEPILAYEEATDYFPLPTDLELDKGQLFMLTISGNSMIEAGIFDGDQVIVRQQNTANNGDIVIAMTNEDEATCKRFYKEANHIRLHPENELLDDIILDQVTILGRVVSLYRSQVF